jgi:hypothetical protein
MDAADKRRAQRFPMALPVAVRVSESETTVKTKDISSSGVYLEFSSPMEIGTSLEFVLTLPHEITNGQAVRVRCKGKIVRVDRGANAHGTLGVAATIERYEFVRPN